MAGLFSLSPYQKEFLSRIIEVPSQGGFPEEGAPYGKAAREVLDVFLDEAKSKGFRTGTVGDRAGWVEFGEGDKLLGIICHLDVVPAGEGWDSDPFTLSFRKDETGTECMYARGIIDDKGPACASFLAMLELIDEGRIPKGYRVRLILGTDEERTCSCIRYYAAHGEVPDFSITPDSVFPVVYSEKGIMQIKVSGKNGNNLIAHGGSAVNIVPAKASAEVNGETISVCGKAAHASKPDLGTNAIELLVKVMEQKGIGLDKYPVLMFVSNFSLPFDHKDLTYNIGILNAGKDGCELRLDLRIPHGADHDAVIENIRNKASEYGLETEVTLDLPPLLMDKDSPEILALTDIWKSHIDRFTGFKEEYRDLHVKAKVEGMGTYARHIPNTIAFGLQVPWKTDQCHIMNEHVEVTDYLEWIKIIKKYIIDFGKILCERVTEA